MPDTIPTVMTIAGSDSGGGAGIQADLKTFAALGVFGTSALTCVTAQNPNRVAGLEPIPSGFVALQINTICDEFPIAAAKTGMLYSAETVRDVAFTLRERAVPIVVVDPISVATSGSSLLHHEAIEELVERLLPCATLITPNIPEAEQLTRQRIRTRDDQEAAARALSERFNTACVVKGGHLLTDPGKKQVHDVLCIKGRITLFSCLAIPADETHGTGCTYSAAITACLAKGGGIPAAIQQAQAYVARVLRHAVHIGSHTPLGWE